jgi:hypothetical protein
MACELLHSLVVFFVGSAASVSSRHGGNKSALELTRILGKLYPGILRLATDVEKVARQLFEPLALQMVRLYSADLVAIDESSVVTAART